MSSGPERIYSTVASRGHRPLVYVTDDETKWGWWCLDCEVTHFGFTSERRPSRLAKRHVKETRPVLQEAS
jgi:hypothetical protein